MTQRSIDNAINSELRFWHFGRWQPCRSSRDVFAGNAGATAFDTEAQGYEQEAQGLTQAADLEGQNEAYAGAAGDIQIAQQQRQNYQVASTTTAAQAGAGTLIVNGRVVSSGVGGFTSGGSGGDILRANLQQGALATQLLGVQKNINEATYQVQEQAYTSQAEAAKAAAAAATAAASEASTGGLFGAAGGVLSGAASIAKMFMV